MSPLKVHKSKDFKFDRKKDCQISCVMFSLSFPLPGNEIKIVWFPWSRTALGYLIEFLVL